MKSTITISAYEYAYLISNLERMEALRRYMGKKQILLREDFDIIVGENRKSENEDDESNEA